MRAKKVDVNEFLAWLTSGKVRSFRILPHQHGEDVTVRWVSSLDPENPEEVTHLSRTGESLVAVLEWIPTYEQQVINDSQDNGPNIRGERDKGPEFLYGQKGRPEQLVKKVADYKRAIHS